MKNKNLKTKNFTLSSNVIEEILKDAEIDKVDENAYPQVFLQVKDVERDNGRYWLTLLEERGKEVFAMFSASLTQKILIQQLLVRPVIELKHYYLHRFEAANFLDNPLTPFINVLGIDEIEIFDAKLFKELSKARRSQLNIEKLPKSSRQKKKRRRRCELELESTDESDNSDLEQEEEITSRKPQIQLNSKSIVEETGQPLKHQNQNINKALADRNDKSKAESTLQSSTSKILDIRSETSQAENIVQPSENKSPNVQTTDISIEAFVGNGRTATPISSLKLTNNSPLVRGYIKSYGAISVSAKGCVYSRFQLKDSSGEILCMIYEPVCSVINNFMKIGAMIEIEHAAIGPQLGNTLSSYEHYKISLRTNTKITLYHDRKCVYEHPSKPNSIVQQPDKATIEEITNNGRYMRLETIKGSLRLVDRTNAIGVLVWMSQLLTVTSNNRPLKCRNLRIQDESGSILVTLWDTLAENVYFPIGSIVSAKNARLKKCHEDIELVIDFKAQILLAEDCAEKTRLQEWYKPAARRMTTKI